MITLISKQERDDLITLVSTLSVSVLIILFCTLAPNFNFSETNNQEKDSTEIADLLQRKIPANKNQHQISNLKFHFRILNTNRLINVMHDFVYFWPEVEEL